MYAYTYDKEVVGDVQVDFTPEKDEQGNSTIEAEELAYWRKFNNLHGWMHDLYVKKGGEDPVFNCNNVRLMPEDLDELEKAAKAKALDPVSGFFFGPEEAMTDEDVEEVMEFIAKAREAINQGKAVFYDSWW